MKKLIEEKEKEKIKESEEKKEENITTSIDTNFYLDEANRETNLLGIN